MNIRKLLSALLLLGLGGSASALEVSGVILDKLAKPLGFAQICLRGTATCVNSGLSNGAFHIVGALSTLPAPRSGELSARISGGRVFVNAPEAGSASLSWFDAEGRRLSPAFQVKLAAGANEIVAPASGSAERGGGPPVAGLRFLRMETGNRSVTWKILFMGSGAFGAAETAGETAFDAGPRPKTSALAPALIITRTGYRTYTYFPKQDPDTAYIFMMAAGDSGLNLTVKDKTKLISSANGTLITEYDYGYCDPNTGSPAQDVSMDSLRYFVKGGKLFLYYEGDCYGMQLGGGTALQSAWTRETWAALPAEVRPQGCLADPYFPGEPQFIKTDRFIFSDSILVEETTGELCPNDYWVDGLMQTFLASDTAVMPVKNTCRRAVFKNSKGDTASIAFTAQGDTLIGTFAAGGKTCVLHESFQPSPVAECASEPAFFDCIAGTGFVPPPTTTLNKVAAERLPMSRERPRRSGFGASIFGKSGFGPASRLRFR